MKERFILAKCLAALVVILFCTVPVQAQVTNGKKKNGAFYLSWGYNTEWYTRSTVTVKQESLGNNYKLDKVHGHDHRGWDEGLLHQDFTIPQYNYRLGYYFNERQDLAFEINFDHTKYIIADSQSIRLRGTLNNSPADTTIFFAEKAGFHYFLNNGANFLLFNLVKRVPLYHTRDRKLYIDFTGKAGIGPVIPHVQNSFFGKENRQGFQFGGWNTGLETAVRVTFMRYAYFEFAQKIDYARYSHLRVYEGRAKQSFGTYELILSLGAIIPTSKNNPLFFPADKVEVNAEKP